MASKLSEDNDFKEVKELCAHLGSKLKGGVVNAEFFVEGSRLSDDKIQQGLQLVAQLYEKLQSLEPKMDRLIAAAEAEESGQGKYPTKTNKNLITTVEDIVERKMRPWIRDLSIKNDRLEESVKKMEEAQKAVLAENKTLKLKLKKSEQADKAQKVNEAQVSVLHRKLEKLEENEMRNRFQNGTETRLIVVEGQVVKVRDDMHASASSMYSKISTAEKSIADLKQHTNSKLAKCNDEIRRTNARIEDELDTTEKNEREIFEGLDSLRASRGNHASRLRQLERETFR